MLLQREVVIGRGNGRGDRFEALQQQGANGKQRLRKCGAAAAAGLKERIQIKTSIIAKEDNELEANCRSNIL